MQIQTNFTPVSYNYNRNNNKSSVSFEGLNFSKMIPGSSAKKEIKERKFLDSCYHMANVIGQKAQTIIDLTRNATQRKISFMKSMVSRYNARNFYLSPNLKEDSTPIINIYKMVGRPESAHFNIINKTDAPFRSIEKIFSVAKDKKSLEFAQRMQHNILGESKNSADMIVDMLKSPNKSSYMAKTEDYVSYLKLNRDNADAVKDLEKMLQGGSYNRTVYDAKLDVKNIMHINPVAAVLGNDSELLERHYSKSGMKLLKCMASEYIPRRQHITPACANDILEMYKTAKPENLRTRMEIVERFKYATKDNLGQISEEAEIKSMRKLFDRMDKDKHVAGFVDKVLGDDIRVSSASEFLEILDAVPAQKAEIFHKNVARIVKYTQGEERTIALQNEIENPFFITKTAAENRKDMIRYGFAKKESRFSKFMKSVENKFNQYKYSHIQPEEGTKASTPVIKPSTVTIETVVPVPVIQKAASEASVVRPVETVTPATVLPVARKFKESPAARKLRVTADVNNIIGEKLGKKTLETQKETYGKFATVMRLKLLPDIFGSISATRAVQRASGQRPRVETRDAVRLYERINGKNKKLVRYMLKQTDENGNRIFDLKDTIYLIDRLEKEIAAKKKVNPKFMAADAKARYEEEFLALVEQYGKLKRARKSK